MKKALGLVVITGIVLGAVSFFIVRAAAEDQTQHMIAAADRVSVPSGWTLTSERIESEKLICLNGNPCPSLHRAWQATEELTEQDLQSIAADAGFSIAVDRSCTRRANVIGNSAVCTGRGSHGGYDFRLTITSPGPGADSVLVLGLEQADGHT